jgi:hypothetical protein
VSHSLGFAPWVAVDPPPLIDQGGGGYKWLLMERAYCIGVERVYLDRNVSVGIRLGRLSPLVELIKSGYVWVAKNSSASLRLLCRADP